MFFKHYLQTFFELKTNIICISEYVKLCEHLLSLYTSFYGGQLESLRFFDHHTLFITRNCNYFYLVIMCCNYAFLPVLIL